MPVLAPSTPAPDFELPSTGGGGPVGLARLRAAGPVVLVFASEECPTCGLALRRLAPLVDPLRAAGIELVAVFEDPPELAARVARRAGFTGATLAEPAPYEVSGAYGLESLPTTYTQKLRKGAIFGDSDPRQHAAAFDLRAIKQSRGRDRPAATGG